MDYSIVFDLIWKLINMILVKNNVFESAAELGVDLTKYIKAPEETTTPAPAAPAAGGSNAGSIVGSLLTGLL